MYIKLNTNEGVRGDEAMAQRVEAEIGDALGHFEERLTAVEVYLSDANGDKHGPDDKTCVIEARPAGHRAVAASHQAETHEEALSVAAEKMSHRLEHELAKTERKKGAPSIRTAFDPEDDL